MKSSSRRLYFKPVLFFSCFVCLLCAAGSYFFLFQYTQDDVNEYQRLMKVSNPTLAGSEQQEPYVAKQGRFGVRKDFTYLKEGMPLKVRLLSERAELVLDRQPEATQIIEEMHGVRAFMQEDLFYVLPDGKEIRLNAEPFLSEGKPMQIVRYIQAEVGSYYYKNETCVAKNVIIERYVVAGHALPQNLSEGQMTLKGVADAVEFNIAGDALHFTAKNFHASLLPLGGL